MKDFCHRADDDDLVRHRQPAIEWFRFPQRIHEHVFHRPRSVGVGFALKGDERFVIRWRRVDLAFEFQRRERGDLHQIVGRRSVPDIFFEHRRHAGMKPAEFQPLSVDGSAVARATHDVIFIRPDVDEAGHALRAGQQQARIGRGQFLGLPRRAFLIRQHLADDDAVLIFFQRLGEHIVAVRLAREDKVEQHHLRSRIHQLLQNRSVDGTIPRPRLLHLLQHGRGGDLFRRQRVELERGRAQTDELDVVVRQILPAHHVAAVNQRAFALLPEMRAGQPLAPRSPENEQADQHNDPLGTMDEKFDHEREINSQLSARSSRK